MGTSNIASIINIINIFVKDNKTTNTLIIIIPTMPAISITNKSLKSNLPITVFLLALILELIFIQPSNELSFLSIIFI